MSIDTIVSLGLFAAALFLMMRFGRGRHMMGHAQSHAHAGAHGGGGASPVATSEDVDPVCGMTVDRSSASTATFQGKTYYFCSDSCRRKFEASAAAYTAKVVNSPGETGHRHGCC
jgi:YHS domain-containing protein